MAILMGLIKATADELVRQYRFYLRQRVRVVVAAPNKASLPSHIFRSFVLFFMWLFFRRKLLYKI